MEITFKDSKLEKQCNLYSKLVQKQGPVRAKIIKRRLDDLRAANSLIDFKFLNGRCHELREDRAGQLSLDLDGPYRLFFMPTNNPIPQLEDGGLDWDGVTAIQIIGIGDPHGK